MQLKYTFSGLLLVVSISLMAQQEPLQTQFMYNKLAYNPGYAGSFESPTLTVINRNQWIGIEGAPSLQAISFNRPLLNNHLGLGFNLTRQAITINKNYTAEVSYAYRIPLYHGYLGMGIQASMRLLQQNWLDDRIITSQPRDIDNAIPMTNENKLVANFGFGGYYQGPRWYVGVSAPRLVLNNIGLGENQGVLTKEARHINAMAGIDFTFGGEDGDAVKLTPQAMFKFVKNAPPDLDVNLTAEFQQKFLTGVTYRVGGDEKNLGESVDIMAGIQATKNLFIMLSYDVAISKLQRYSNGSIEATARWYFNPPEGNDFINPDRPDEVRSGSDRKGLFKGRFKKKNKESAEK